METTPVALYLEGGIRVETEVDVPADLEDDEILKSLTQRIAERTPTPYKVIGGVTFRVEAFRAIELL